MEYMVRLHFLASNNATEYKALINGLRITVELGIKRLEIRGDSELVVEQVMKDKNCVDPRMAAYCQTVRDLEGKFHGLELHHVLRDYNKAANVLTKAASSRSLVPHGVFASDQHQSSIREEGERPPEEPEPEVMVIDQPPEVNLKDPDWRFPILECLVEGKLPSDQTEARRIARQAKAFFSSSTASSTSVGLSAYSCGASSEIKAASCCRKYMPAPVVTMPVREHLLGKLSDKVSTGPRWSPTRRTLCSAVKGANSTPGKLTPCRKHCRQSPSRGPSQSRTSTWWDLSDKRPGASPTFS
jgi:ribonuclease HI